MDSLLPNKDWLHYIIFSLEVFIEAPSSAYLPVFIDITGTENLWNIVKFDWSSPVDPKVTEM